MSNEKSRNDSPPVKAEVGNETDVEQTAQTISSREIEALVVSEEPTDRKLEALQTMKSELQARLAKNHGDDLAPLAEQVDSAIDQLSSAGGEAGVRSPLKTH